MGWGAPELIWPVLWAPMCVIVFVWSCECMASRSYRCMLANTYAIIYKLKALLGNTTVFFIYCADLALCTLLGAIVAAAVQTATAVIVFHLLLNALFFNCRNHCFPCQSVSCQKLRDCSLLMTSQWHCLTRKVNYAWFIVHFTLACARITHT